MTNEEQDTIETNETQDTTLPPTAVPANAKEVQKFTHAEALTNCRLDPSGRYAFAGAEDFGVYRWNLETGEKVVYRGVHDSWVRRIDFSNDGTHVFTSGWDGRVVVWEVEPKSVEEIALPVEKTSAGQAEQTDGEAGQQVVPEVELVVENPVRIIDAHRGFARWVHAGPNGKYVATCGNDKVIRLWDAK